MLTEPGDLDRTELEDVLARHWALREVTLTYLQVGFGSHHWRAEDARGTRRFITVDDLEAGFQAGPDTNSAFAALERAFRTAAALRDDAYLEFVVAPLADDEGQVIRRVSDRYAVTVAPFVEGESSTYGAYDSLDDRRRMGGILGRLHAATHDLPVGLPRREDFALPSRAALVEALDDLERPWSSGPLAEHARQLLKPSAREIERRLREYDELVARVAGDSNRWVVTHGEPHRANVIADGRGGVYLVDWDTTLIAPRERDLRMVLDRHLTGWDEYLAVAGPLPLNREAIELYDCWWYLADVGIFTALLRRPHERTEDTIASFEHLAAYLRVADR